MNTTTIYFKTERIYPVETSEEDGYYDDFAMEEDAGNLLADLTASYVNYEVMLAVVKRPCGRERAAPEYNDGILKEDR